MLKVLVLVTFAGVAWAYAACSFHACDTTECLENPVRCAPNEVIIPAGFCDCCPTCHTVLRKYFHIVPQ